MSNLVLKTKYVLLALLVAFSFSSCSPDDGEQGPQGPEGPESNANVTSVLLENQTINTGNTVFVIPELTQDIFDNGIVYAYVTVTGNDYWEVLPLSTGGNIILEIDRIEVGQVTLKANFTQGSLKLRFVLVAGNAVAMSSEDVTKMAYGEAMNYFGLDY
jgi:hypothetical protein